MLGWFCLIFIQLGALAGLTWCLNKVNLAHNTLKTNQNHWLDTCQSNRKTLSALARNSNDWHHSVQAAGLMVLKRTGWVGLILKYWLKSRPV